MTFEEELSRVLASYAVLAARSEANLRAILRDHDATPEETERELAWHRDEVETERRRVAEEFWRWSTREANGWFERDNRELQ